MNSPDVTYGMIDASLLEGLNDKQREAVVNWESYAQFQKAMSTVSINMREIPTLPSEVIPEHDKHGISTIELPAEGGVLTYMDHFDQPYRGFPLGEFVTTIDLVKKLTKGWLSGLFHSFRANRLKVILVFPALLVFRELFWTVTYAFQRLVERQRVKPYKFSKAIRELYRAFSQPRRDSLRDKELRLMLRDVVCMILEFDNAYRFRAQDVLFELDKEALRKNPIKELNRLADVATRRELEQQVKDTWRLLKMFNSIYLRFNRGLKNIVVDVLTHLNLEEFKLTPEDVAFCDPRKDYIFGYKQNVINKPL